MYITILLAIASAPLALASPFRLDKRNCRTTVRPVLDVCMKTSDVCTGNNLLF
ncbi:uncharacterized protein SETTUDRAFT_169736 [Exserohilum turcica Et28A]|uniref:Uncharacterized protein n=1 Tax=Exserohilum turcicum (strain 28A) TaxID=671987 RepID=R0IKD2_EXST2|nr:uncharacterized protein SETTUDRAFT_169736 [Exserohilum turcica Et28A]EOA85560.1 hypothetical protein SETTUDRAFT_169736 [Exserohilum turcica Et28A]